MKFLLAATAYALLAWSALRAESVTVQLYDYDFTPNDPDRPKTQAVNRLMEQDPGLRVVPWGGLIVPGASGRATLMMAIAGQNAPDIFESWYHGINTDIRQGFLYPLTSGSGTTRTENGQIDDDEARWPGWKKIPKLWRQVATVDGKIYGIPQPTSRNMALIFRMDLVRAAGLNPDQPPQTWDEFYYWCQKLTGPNRTTPGCRRRGSAASACKVTAFSGCRGCSRREESRSCRFGGAR